MGYAAVNSKQSHASIPTQLFGYEVLGYLGTGAGSEIYAVTDPKTRQIYALKHVVKTDANRSDSSRNWKLSLKSAGRWCITGYGVQLNC